jgi:hypothetical protein
MDTIHKSKLRCPSGAKTLTPHNLAIPPQSILHYLTCSAHGHIRPAVRHVYRPLPDPRVPPARATAAVARWSERCAPRAGGGATAAPAGGAAGGGREGAAGPGGAPAAAWWGVGGLFGGRRFGGGGVVGAEGAAGGAKD